MKLVTSLLALLLFFSSAYAQGEAPVIYTKTILKIVPKPAAVKIEAEKDKSKKEEESAPREILPKLPRVAKEFTVEVRPLSFLAQRDFIAHQPFTDTGGMMILIDPPAITPLKAANLLAKVDVLFIAQDGTIRQIAPGIALSELGEPVVTETPVRAFVFLKNGTAKSNDITPGDHITNVLFNAHPVILEESSPQK